MIQSRSPLSPTSPKPKSTLDEFLEERAASLTFKP